MFNENFNAKREGRYIGFAVAYDLDELDAVFIPAAFEAAARKAEMELDEFLDVVFNPKRPMIEMMNYLAEAIGQAQQAA
jgi:hypothetical protein